MPDFGEVPRRARSHRSQPRSGIPHWEPLWTPEYALDRMAELRRLGFFLNFSWVHAHENGLSIAVLKSGTWDHALQRIGLDPCGVRLIAPAQPLSPEQVIARIQARSGDRLNEGAVIKEGVQLLNAARWRFGS